MKKIIDKLFSYFYHKHDDKAFNMPFETDEEKEACRKYINYNIDPLEKKHIEIVSHAIASQENNSFALEFYKRLFKYKIKKLMFG